MNELTIHWTSMERAADGSGDTRYFGMVDGERMYVVHGYGRPAGSGRGSDRRFRAYRITSAGTEYPAAEGGEHKRLHEAKDACAGELSVMVESGTAEGRVHDLRERRGLLVELHELDPGNHAAVEMTLVELRDVVRAARAVAAAGDRGTMTITPTGAAKIAAHVASRQPAAGAAVAAAVRTVQLAGRAQRAPIALETLPEPHQQVDMWIHEGRRFSAGDVVRFPGPVCEPGDRWTIEHIVVGDGREPYASLRLTARTGGTGYGELRTAVRLGLLGQVASLTEPVGISPRQLVAEVRELREQVDLLRARSMPESYAQVLAGALRRLRDENLPARIRQSMLEDVLRETRDAPLDPEAVVMHPGDVRTLIEALAEQLGVKL